MQNPFDVIDNRLSNIESLLLDLKHGTRAHQPEHDDDRFITRQDAAKLLGVGLATLDKMAKFDVLQKYRNGSIVRFKKSEVLETFKTFKKRKRHQFEDNKPHKPSN